MMEAPSLAEIEGMLPAGVFMVSYRPKTAPFAVSPISTVTDAGKFLRAYLRDLRSRLANPGTHAAPPLAEILAKLAAAGLELRIEA